MVAAEKTLTVRKQTCKARDGTFCELADGIVKDTKTGLEWKAGPDQDVTWSEAKRWVEGLNVEGEGGWRMPTLDELMTLYEKDRGKTNRTSLLENGGWFVWSGEAGYSSSAGGVNFRAGFRDSYARDLSDNLRVFAVRSGSDG